MGFSDVQKNVHPISSTGTKNNKSRHSIWTRIISLRHPLRFILSRSVQFTGDPQASSYGLTCDGGELPIAAGLALLPVSDTCAILHVHVAIYLSQA